MGALDRTTGAAAGASFGHDPWQPARALQRRAPAAAATGGADGDGAADEPACCPEEVRAEGACSTREKTTVSAKHAPKPLTSTCTFWK